MSFTKRVLLGLCAGVACGLFLGPRVAPIQILATGFVKLLQMTVLPYVLISIISSLGALSYGEARRLGVRVGAVILVLWSFAITFALLIPTAFPVTERASFFSSSMVEDRPPFNFVDLYIPSNPFHSLANNVVPAIVLFSVMLGVALIGVPEKQRLLDVLKVAMNTVSRATHFVVRLTPYGIFAIATHASGTMSLEEAGKIEIYLVAYVAMALLLALWVFPALVSTLTPIPLKEVFSANRDALVTAFVAGDLFIVLPALMESCEQLLLRHRIGQHDEHKLPEVIIPASFNFPHAGKLLSLSFILFAGWFSDAALPMSHYPQLAATGLLTIFGSLNSAVPFLLDLFRIPADTFQLYLATGVLNARFGALLAAVHVIAVGILGSAALAGAVRFRTASLVRFGVITLLMTAGTLGGLKLLFSHAMAPRFDGASLVNSMRPLAPHSDSIVLPAGSVPLSGAPSTGGVYDEIRARGILRVGFFPDRMPFAYFNAEGKLVGLEVETAHLLAEGLGVQPRFIQIAPEDLSPAMASGTCDIIMSGVVLTPLRQAEALFSSSYMDETLGFAVLDHRRQEFTNWELIREGGALRIAVPDFPHYLLLVRKLLPSANIVPVPISRLKLDAGADFDAYVMPAEFGAAQTLLNPRFTIVVPSPSPIRLPIAYPLAKRDRIWADVVNTWIELRQKDGTFEQLKKHWILGQSAKPRTPRWSLLSELQNWGVDSGRAAGR